MGTSHVRRSRRYKPLRVTATDDPAPLVMWDTWNTYHEAILADLAADHRRAVQALNEALGYLTERPQHKVNVNQWGVPCSMGRTADDCNCEQGHCQSPAK
jgi:hypothetical protein